MPVSPTIRTPPHHCLPGQLEYRPLHFSVFLPTGCIASRSFFLECGLHTFYRISEFDFPLFQGCSKSPRSMESQSFSVGGSRPLPSPLGLFGVSSPPFLALPPRFPVINPSLVVLPVPYCDTSAYQIRCFSASIPFAIFFPFPIQSGFLNEFFPLRFCSNPSFTTSRRLAASPRLSSFNKYTTPPPPFLPSLSFTSLLVFYIFFWTDCLL